MLEFSKILKSGLILLLFPTALFSQVELRDTVISWQNHVYNLNDDYSMDYYSTADNSRQIVRFNAKVIENDLIRLVVIPEYGARVISFIYKPSGHEYLYQSECGSPYGMNEGNFYYDWLLVYGGIFPTFPEPEHGKSWLLPWKYDLVKNTGDTVIIGMEYTDTTAFSRAPGKFNNGITNITCRIEIGVFESSSLWDFNVSLKNNKSQNVKYEYWTCTTLTPGSETGNTGSPLNSEMLVPIEKYEAAWSPGNWIGRYGSLYDFSAINYLSKWNDMGIGYAYDLRDNYWGVINHDNEEGIFRISENIETPGMKFWTWGKNNIENNLYDFSNGGADNYIELWAGVSEAFFEDATLSPLEEVRWKESYVPTMGLSSVSKINRSLAVNILWDQAVNELSYEIMAFSPNREYRISMYLHGESYYSVIDKTIFTDVLGNTEAIELDDVYAGDYMVVFEVYDNQDELLISAEKEISSSGTGVFKMLSEGAKNPSMIFNILGNRKVSVLLPVVDEYELEVYNLSGQMILNRGFWASSIDLSFPADGVYIINVRGKLAEFSDKVVVR